jgi:outer membrane lipoprotein SlyB
MDTQHKNMLVGVFASRNDAHQAINELVEAGFGGDNVGFAARESDDDVGDVPMEEVEDLQDDASSGAVAGLAGGGAVGGLLGAGAAVLIPGVGPMLAAGILAAGVATGAFAGGLYGPFVNMGATEEEAKYYDQEFKAGASIVTVDAGDKTQEAREILKRNNAKNIERE